MGNLYPIDHQRCWDVYDFPKIVDLKTGQLLAEDRTLISGKQCSSIIHHLELPKIAFNEKTRQLAIATDQSIEVLTP